MPGGSTTGHWLKEGGEGITRLREVRLASYFPYPGSALPFSLMWPVVQRMARVMRSR